jgi:hypothetical protein
MSKNFDKISQLFDYFYGRSILAGWPLDYEPINQSMGSGIHKIELMETRAPRFGIYLNLSSPRFLERLCSQLSNLYEVSGLCYSIYDY